MTSVLQQPLVPLVGLPPATPKQTGGKRGAPGAPLLILHESDDDLGDLDSLPPSPRAAIGNTPSPRNLQASLPSSLPSSLPLSLPLSLPSSLPSSLPFDHQAYHAYEHDHDYENVASPTSSTASGPIYVRPPGFKHHAQEITAKRVKKKKTATAGALVDIREGIRRRAPTPPKLRPKRGKILHVLLTYTIL
jgi:hypothetical protein